ncbi:class I SAM-dependent methyltransferase [Paractinoplanes atraurantiacus]|uniref:Methyltransferase domain-containing protein n=1 Tax=Paractinoplanes atraurantiacus TaxID=1036182 RepID=A0A285KKB3_9ACTN|nr:class I SAM-dependent methyltransferase [Actinoplanes atraurantiacus]SNY73084.1 Methyltransferase domain-containing protein [Actinoplanes atraurantiacus]
MTAFTAHPVRGRLNAAVFRSVDGYADHLFGERKRELFAGLPGTVVEIGPGTGANLRHYRAGTRLVAIEPNPYMHEPLMANARRRGVTVDLRAASAEHTGLDDGEAQAVVSTLVLCTVPDPAAALREIARILRPGGRLIFVEHVGAARGSGYDRLQRAVATPWRWFFEGCEVSRDTEGLLQAAGFAELSVSRYRVRSVFLPINTQIAGVAVR